MMDLQTYRLFGVMGNEDRRLIFPCSNPTASIGIGASPLLDPGLTMRNTQAGLDWQ